MYQGCCDLDSRNYGRIVPFFDTTFNGITVINIDLCDGYHVPKTTAYVLSYTCATNITKPGGGLLYRSTPFLGYPRGKLPLTILVNLLAGDISTNPGPEHEQGQIAASTNINLHKVPPTTRRRGRKPKWPCGICKYACTTDCIMCTDCEQWFHNRCSNASEEVLNHHVMYQEAVWICPLCDDINITTAAFSNAILETSNPYDSLDNLNHSHSTASPIAEKVSPLRIKKMDNNWTIVDNARQFPPPTRKQITPLKIKRTDDKWICVGNTRPKQPNTSTTHDCDETARLHHNQVSTNRSTSTVPVKVTPLKIKRKDDKWTCVNETTTAAHHKNGFLNIANVNCNGIRSKVPQLEIFLDIENIDVVIGTESKLGNDVYNAEVFPPNYRVYRRDRASGGGGVFIAVRDNIPCYIRSDLMMDSTELIWCQLTLKDQNVLVGAFYRQPKRTIDDSLINLDQSLATLRNTTNAPYIILGGDFNVPDMNWTDETVTADNPLQEKLLDIADDHQLTQTVPFTTRRHANGTENTLDLLYTSHPSLLNKVRPHSGISDHSAVLATFDTKVKIKAKPSRSIPQWKSVDEVEFRKQAEELARNFHRNQPENKTVDENWKFFGNSMNNLVKSHVPHKTYRGNRGAPWFNNHLKKMTRKKEKLYARAKNSSRDDHWTAYKDYQKKVNKAIRKSKRNHVSEIISSDQPKKFWRFVRSNKKDNTGVPVLKVNNITLTKDSEKAAALSTQFQSVFTREDPESSSLPCMDDPPYEDMPDIIVSTEGVEKLLRNIDPTKAAGPDEVSNYALKIAAQEIAPVLSFIFQQSIDTGELPDDWRKANISPIYKKGDTTDPANYRPISLTSVCCKLLEHIIDSQLMKHLDKFSILTDEQHAFRRARSTESQLILTTHDLAKNLDDRITTDLAILDFSKAFDVVPHKKLLIKLDHYGIRGNTKRWIENFLTQRLQRVTINGTPSTWEKVLSGVPQGTVLGPHLFLLFINDIGDGISSKIRLFADDCLVYRAIKSPADETILQNDLDRLVDWTNTWGMHFNPKKCNIMRVSNRRNQEDTNYKMLGTKLEQTNTCQYLGIHIQDNLKWSKQAQHAASKASRTLGFIKRNFHHASANIKEKLYHTLVRPHLEYGIAAWDPYYTKDINIIEKVQRRAARFTVGNYSYEASVTEMLKNLKWDSLQDRRRAHRLTCLYKIYHDELDISKTYIAPKTDRTRRGHNQQLKLYSTKLAPFANSFFPRTVKEWNDLPQQTIDKTSKTSFIQSILT